MATEHPSKLFGTAGRAFHLLENEGVDTQNFLQRIIDDPDFRGHIVELHRVPNDIWHRLDLLRLQTLFDGLFGPDERRVSVGQLPPRVQGRWDDMPSIQKFHFLTKGLSHRDIDIFCMRTGLYKTADFRRRTPASKIAVQYDLTTYRVKSIRDSVMTHIRHTGRELISGTKKLPAPSRQA